MSPCCGQAQGLLGERSEDLLDDLDDEEAIRAQMRREMRDSEHVTQEMREEIMELLDLFGIPYLVRLSPPH